MARNGRGSGTTLARRSSGSLLTGPQIGPAGLAEAVGRVRRVHVSGLAIEVDPEAFLSVAWQAAASGQLILTGLLRGLRARRRIYLTTLRGATFYARLRRSRRLDVAAIEVDEIDAASLSL